MNIFVLGYTHTGKSSLCDLLVEKTAFNYVKGSKWVRSIFSEDINNLTFLENITAFSIKKLAENQDVCIDFVRQELKQDNIIDGFRNVNDFMKLFNYKTDKVILLKLKNNSVAPTKFDLGVDVIESSLNWFINVGLYDRSKFKILKFDYLRKRERKSDSDVILEQLLEEKDFLDDF